MSAAFQVSMLATYNKLVEWWTVVNKVCNISARLSVSIAGQLSQVFSVFSGLMFAVSLIAGWRGGTVGVRSRRRWGTMWGGSGVSLCSLGVKVLGAGYEVRITK